MALLLAQIALYSHDKRLGFCDTDDKRKPSLISVIVNRQKVKLI